MATFEEKKLILETKVTRVPRTRCTVVDWNCNGRYFGTEKKMEDMSENDFDRIARVLNINFDEVLRSQRESVQRGVERKEKARAKAKNIAVIKECRCGCGGSTKSKFCPGHDSKFKAALSKRVAAGDQTAWEVINELGWERLFAK